MSWFSNLFKNKETGSILSGNDDIISINNNGKSSQIHDKSKICEYCFIETNNPIFGLVAAPKCRINLAHPSIVNIDRFKQIITLKDGIKLDYSYQINDSDVIEFDNIQPHIFCSEMCIYEYVHEHKIYFSPDNGILKENYFEHKLFLPEVISTNIEIFADYDECVCCNQKFPNTKKVYHIYPIAKSIKIKSNFNEIPPQIEGYDNAHSDMSKYSPSGYWYFYKVDEISTIEHFCSNDCAFNYSIKNNSYIMFMNNFEGICLSVITPHLKEINLGLKNKYSIRPIRSNILLDNTNNSLTSLEKSNYMIWKPFNEGIRFLDGNSELVEYKCDGIWMEPFSEFDFEGQIFISFRTEVKILLPNLKKCVLCLPKNDIEFAYKLSKVSYSKLDNYIYPIIPPENKSHELDRLNDLTKKQIFQLVQFILGQYFILRHIFKNNLEGLLNGLVKMLYKKDTNFPRKKLYYNSNFYLHPLDDTILEQIILKAQNDFKQGKKNNTSIYEPKGLRDEEEMLLSYIDTILLREFFLNKFDNELEVVSYSNYIPDLVSSLFEKLKIESESNLKINFFE